MTAPQLDVLPDADAVASRAAAYVGERAREAVSARGVFTFAVSGGRTPAAMLARLSEEDVPWERVSIFQVDERVAPPGHPDRNLTMLLRGLPARAQERILAMPVIENDLDAAAQGYARALPRVLDLVHLGLGADGHTASLVPGDPVLEVDDRDVALTGVYDGRRRMTLTYPVLARARRILWLVTGEDKAPALRRLLAGDETIPAGRVPGDRALVFADASAAAVSEPHRQGGV